MYCKLKNQGERRENVDITYFLDLISITIPPAAFIAAVEPVAVEILKNTKEPLTIRHTDLPYSRGPHIKRKKL
jgi:hypothetical protein